MVQQINSTSNFSNVSAPNFQQPLNQSQRFRQAEQDTMHFGGSGIGDACTKIGQIIGNIFRAIGRCLASCFHCIFPTHASTTSETTVPVDLGDAQEIPAYEDASVTAAQRAQRKTDALARLRQIQGGGISFEPAHTILTFNLNTVLARYNENLDLDDGFTNLLRFSGAEQNRSAFQNVVLSRYGRNNGPREAEVQKILSKIIDFFAQKREHTPQGSPQEVALKTEIRNVINRIVDAHGNCVDQVLSQLENIVIEVIAPQTAVASSGGSENIAASHQRRLQHLAGHALFQYRARKIQEICVQQNPDEHHMADLERVVKQRLAELLGMQGDVFAVGAQYAGIVDSTDARVESIAQTFVDGYTNATILTYLTNELKNHFGIPRILRNNLLSWARSYYALDNDANPLTAQMITAISENPDNDIMEGGAFSNHGLLLLLEEAGIIT